MIRFVVPVLGLIAVGFSSIASAQDVDLLQQADQLFESRDFENAKRLYTEAIEAGGRSPAELSRAYLRLGIVEASFYDLDDAIELFEKARAINPSLEVPTDLSPSQRGAFQSAHTGPAVSITVATSPGVGGVSLEALVQNAPSGWVTRYRAQTTEWNDVGGDPSMLIPREVFGDATSLTVQVEALDTWGNIIARTTETVSAPVSITAREVAESDPLDDEDPIEEPPRRSRTGLWIGIASAVVVVAAVAIIVPLALRDDTAAYGTPMVEW